MDEVLLERLFDDEFELRVNKRTVSIVDLKWNEVISRPTTELVTNPSAFDELANDAYALRKRHTRDMGPTHG